MSNTLLERFGIDKFTGFLPNTPCISLGSEGAELEAFCNNIPIYVASGSLRKQALPIFDVNRLTGDKKQIQVKLERARLLLCTIAHPLAHGIPWHGEAPMDTLPLPLCTQVEQVSLALKTKPVLNYSALVLNNWSTLSHDPQVDANQVQIEIGRAHV